MDNLLMYVAADYHEDLDVSTYAVRVIDPISGAERFTNSIALVGHDKEIVLRSILSALRHADSYRILPNTITIRTNNKIVVPYLLSGDFHNAVMESSAPSPIQSELDGLMRNLKDSITLEYVSSEKHFAELTDISRTKAINKVK